MNYISVDSVYQVNTVFGVSSGFFFVIEAKIKEYNTYYVVCSTAADITTVSNLWDSKLASC